MRRFTQPHLFSSSNEAEAQSIPENLDGAAGIDVDDDDDDGVPTPTMTTTNDAKDTVELVLQPTHCRCATGGENCIENS